MRRPGRILLLALVAGVLLAPAALGHHAAPASDKFHGGKSFCRTEFGERRYNGEATEQLIPLQRATDAGRVTLINVGLSRDGTSCTFGVRITGFTLFGANPEGAVSNMQIDDCPTTTTCDASVSFDWRVTLLDPLRGVQTSGMQIDFEFLSDGKPVDASFFRVVFTARPAVP